MGEGEVEPGSGYRPRHQRILERGQRVGQLCSFPLDDRLDAIVPMIVSEQTFQWTDPHGGLADLRTTGLRCGYTVQRHGRKARLASDLQHGRAAPITSTCRDSQMPEEIRQFELDCLLERGEFELRCGFEAARRPTAVSSVSLRAASHLVRLDRGR